jgi:hypothetical protein
MKNHFSGKKRTNYENSLLVQAGEETLGYLKLTPPNIKLAVHFLINKLKETKQISKEEAQEIEEQRNV